MFCLDDSVDLEKVQSKIVQSLKDTYEAVERNLQKIRIKTIDTDIMEQRRDHKSIVKSIISQNKLVSIFSKVNVLYRSQIKNNDFNIILEAAFSILLGAGKLGTDWSVCRVNQDYEVFDSTIAANMDLLQNCMSYL